MSRRIRAAREAKAARREQAEALEAGYTQYLLDENEFGKAERELGEDHPDTLAARLALADLLLERGSFEAAGVVGGAAVLEPVGHDPGPGGRRSHCWGGGEEMRKR